MTDPDGIHALLSTLAQSSAAIVAIVGGFLVSRLVQLSSERGGLRRRLADAEGELQHVEQLYAEAHDYRLANSQEEFFRWVIEDLVKVEGEVDLGKFVENLIPRGSSPKEMGPYLEELVKRVATAREAIAQFVNDDEVADLELEELQKRGLVVPSTEVLIYVQVVYQLQQQLPIPHVNLGFMGSMPDPMFSAALSPSLVGSSFVATDARRLDESIRDEQQFDSRRTILAAEVKRVASEIRSLGRPAGVVAAIVILGIYSLLGVVAPVVAMTLSPDALDPWEAWLLVGLFVSGLVVVLIYIGWYAATLGTRGKSTSSDGGDGGNG